MYKLSHCSFIFPNSINMVSLHISLLWLFVQSDKKIPQIFSYFSHNRNSENKGLFPTKR